VAMMMRKCLDEINAKEEAECRGTLRSHNFMPSRKMQACGVGMPLIKKLSNLDNADIDKLEHMLCLATVNHD